MTKWAGLLMIGAGVAGASVVYPLLSDSPSGSAPSRPAVQATLPPPPVQRPAVVLAPAPETRTIAADPAGSRSAPSPQPRSAAVAEPAPVLTRPVEAAQPLLPRTSRSDEGRQTSARDLARDIQRELRRVGCYRGELDGAWSAETQQAMRTFIDRVNAALPIDEPDHILKTLVQGHPGGACGSSCPTGQALTSDGRCLPSAVVAQAPRKAAPKDLTVAQQQPAAPLRGSEPSATTPAAAAPVAAASPPPAPLPGRMAAGAAVESGVAKIAPAPADASPPVVVLRPKSPRALETAAVEPAREPAPTVSAAPVAEPPAPRPTLGAVRAMEQPFDEGRVPQPRRHSVASIPAPRYVGAPPPQRSQYYAPPPRPRFGPNIFRELERNAR